MSIEVIEIVKKVKCINNLLPINCKPHPLVPSRWYKHKELKLGQIYEVIEETDQYYVITIPEKNAIGSYFKKRFVEVGNE